MASELEIKWLHELSKDNKTDAFCAVRSLNVDLIEKFFSECDNVSACLELLSGQVIDEFESEPENWVNNFQKPALSAFVKTSPFLPWLRGQVEIVSHGDPLRWFALVPVLHHASYILPGSLEFKFPVLLDIFALDILRALIRKLIRMKRQQKGTDLMGLTAKNYKTPRHFCEDESIPLRSVNRKLKIDWEFLEKECGAIQLAFPGADPIVLLSPMAQEYLRAILTTMGALEMMFSAPEQGKKWISCSEQVEQLLCDQPSSTAA